MLAVRKKGGGGRPSFIHQGESVVLWAARWMGVIWFG
jgi:hypothetical protein